MRTMYYLKNPNGQKYATLMKSATREMNKYKYSMLVVNETGRLDISCSFLEKPLTPIFRYWFMHMVSKYWIFQSLQRIRDAGLDLDHIWEKWAGHLMVLRRKARYKEIEQRIAASLKMDVIDITEIRSRCLLCLQLIWLSSSNLCSGAVDGKSNTPSCYLSFIKLWCRVPLSLKSFSGYFLMCTILIVRESCYTLV